MNDHFLIIKFYYTRYHVILSGFRQPPVILIKSYHYDTES